MKAGFPFHKQCILQDNCSGMRTNSIKIKENVYFSEKSYTFHQKI